MSLGEILAIIIIAIAILVTIVDAEDGGRNERD